MGSAAVKPLGRGRNKNKSDDATEVRVRSRRDFSNGDGNVNENKVNIQQEKRIAASIFSNDDNVGCFSFRSSRPVKFSKSRRRLLSSCDNNEDPECNLSVCPSTQTPHPNRDCKVHILEQTRRTSTADTIFPPLRTNQTVEKSIRWNEIANSIRLPNLFSKQTHRSLNNIQETSSFSSKTAPHVQQLTSKSTCELNKILNANRNASPETTPTLYAFDKHDKLIKTLSLSTKDFNQYCLDRRKLLDRDICQGAKMSSPEYNDLGHEEDLNISKPENNGGLEGHEVRIDSPIDNKNSTDYNGRLELIENVFTSGNRIPQMSQSTEILVWHSSAVIDRDKLDLDSNIDDTDSNIVESIITSPDRVYSDCYKSQTTCKESDDNTNTSSTLVETPTPLQKQSPESNGAASFAPQNQNRSIDVPKTHNVRLASKGKSGPRLKSTFHMSEVCEEQSTSTYITPVMCVGDVGEASLDPVSVTNCPDRNDRGDSNFKTSSKSSPSIISKKPPRPHHPESTNSGRPPVPSVGCSRQAAPAATTSTTSTLSKEDMKQQMFDEGLKPAATDGGVSFFIPVSDQGLKPQASAINIAERITKPKRNHLRYEEKMMMANINRQIQISKRNKFALKDIANVKEALSASASCSDISRPDHTKKSHPPPGPDYDELDREFGL